MFPNSFHESNFEVILSNMPSLPHGQEFRLMKYYDLSVKNITLPGYSLNTRDSIYQGRVAKQVLTPRDSDLDSFTITFKMTEDGLNYFYIMRWMMLHRYGINENEMSDQILEQKIKKMVVNFYSNQKVKVAEYGFNNVICTNLSNLSLTYGSLSEAEFNCTFEYDSIDIDIFPN